MRKHRLFKTPISSDSYDRRSQAEISPELSGFLAWTASKFTSLGIRFQICHPLCTASTEQRRHFSRVVARRVFLLRVEPAILPLHAEVAELAHDFSSYSLSFFARNFFFSHDMSVAESEGSGIMKKCSGSDWRGEKVFGPLWAKKRGFGPPFSAIFTLSGVLKKILNRPQTLY